MRKGFFWILIAVLTFLIIIVCINQSVNESINPTETVEIMETQGDNLEKADVTTKDKSEVREETVNETIQIENSGFVGGVLDDSDTYTELDKEMIGADEKQEKDKSVETTGGEDVVSDNKDGSGSKDGGTEEKVPEESGDAGPIKDNTYDGDLIEPPAVGSDGVL